MVRRGSEEEIAGATWEVETVWKENKHVASLLLLSFRV